MEEAEDPVEETEETTEIPPEAQAPELLCKAILEGTQSMQEAQEEEEAAVQDPQELEL